MQTPNGKPRKKYAFEENVDLRYRRWKAGDANSITKNDMRLMLYEVIEMKSVPPEEGKQEKGLRYTFVLRDKSNSNAIVQARTIAKKDDWLKLLDPAPLYIYASILKPRKAGRVPIMSYAENAL